MYITVICSVPDQRRNDVLPGVDFFFTWTIKITNVGIRTRAIRIQAYSYKNKCIYI